MGWTTAQATAALRRAGCPDALQRACGEPRRSKYGAVKTLVDGVRFDSKAEAQAYQSLSIAAAKGLITGLRLQPRYELQAKFTDAHGLRHRAIEYVADFEFTRDGVLIAADIKGVSTPVFRQKAKMFALRYPHIRLEIWTQ